MRSRGSGGSGQNQNSAAFIIRAVLQGTLLSVLVLFVASGLLGLVVSFTAWESAPGTLEQSINYLSVLVGGLLAGKVAGKTGWLHGGLVGILYMLVAAFIGSGEIATLWTSVFALRLLAGFATGALGGMLGVNLR